MLAATDTVKVRIISAMIHLLSAGKDHSFSIIPKK
jgi:hypothetical protein